MQAAELRERGPGGGGRRVLLLIRALGYGGAERQLVLLAKGLAARGIDVVVACFYPGGGLATELEHVEGVRVLSLEKRGRWDVLGFLRRLRRTVRATEPDVVYGWMFGGGLFAVLGTLFSGTRRVVGLRGSALDTRRYGWTWSLLIRSAVLASRLAERVVVNSHTGREEYAGLGIDPDRTVVVPNGIEVERFRFDPTARERLRGEWRLSADDLLIGHVGRLDPMKDHATFLLAAAALARGREDVRFVCVPGDGRAELADELRRESARLGLEERLAWVEPQSDMVAVYSALDLLCSSSAFGEGFPNVVAEAMACGRPCVVTDVGDARRIVGDTGVVVEPGDPDALAKGLSTALSAEREEVGRRARRRICEHFGVRAMVDATERVLWRTEPLAPGHTTRAGSTASGATPSP